LRLVRTAAAKHVGVKVVPTEVAHQKRSHSARNQAVQVSGVHDGLEREAGATQWLCWVHQGAWFAGAVDRCEASVVLLSLIVESPNLDAA